MVYSQQQKQYCFYVMFYFRFYRMQTSAGSLYFCCEKGKIQNNTFFIYSLYYILVNKKGQKMKLPTIE